MPTRWQTQSLKQAGVILIDCDHRTPPAEESGLPYVTIPQIKDGRIELSGARLISESNFIEWTRKANPAANDVVLSRRCNPGESAYVPQGIRFALGQNLVLLRSTGASIHPPFLRWLLRGPDWWEQVNKFINVGAIFNSLKCKDIPNFELPIPPVEEQKRIVEVLGSLDDKIELNRKMNETLEQMARAIFKSWFIDFDPVHAKRQGKKPFGMDDATAALFPDSFEQSELGEIPKGWRLGAVLDIAALISGGTPKTSEATYWDGDIPWASAKDVSQAGVPFIINTERTITDLGLNNSSTKMVPQYATAVVARGATTGRYTMFGKDMAMNQTCYALETKQKTPFYLNGLLAFEIPKLVNAAHGSVFATITTETFRLSKLVLPTSNLMLAFENEVEPLFKLILSNLKESSHLEQTRDLLLPRLLSGELTIKEAKS